MTVAEEPLIAGEATEGVSSPGTAPGGTADGHRGRLRWGIATGDCALVLFGGYAALDMVPSRGQQGQSLMLYFLMGADDWKLILFVLGGLCLSAALACLVPPPVSKIRLTWLRRGLKVLLGLLFVMALACWSLFSLLLLLTASVWSYSTYSDTEGHHVLVGGHTDEIDIWTPYAGPLYEQYRDAALTDLEAVTTRNCSLSSGDPGLILSCGRDRITIPENIR